MSKSRGIIPDLFYIFVGLTLIFGIIWEVWIRTPQQPRYLNPYYAYCRGAAEGALLQKATDLQLPEGVIIDPSLVNRLEDQCMASLKAGWQSPYFGPAIPAEKGGKP